MMAGCVYTLNKQLAYFGGPLIHVLNTCTLASDIEIVPPSPLLIFGAMLAVHVNIDVFYVWEFKFLISSWFEQDGEEYVSSVRTCLDKVAENMANNLLI